MRTKLTITITALALAGVLGALAFAATTTTRDKVKETPELVRKPNLDIVKSRVGATADGRLKHSITMRGRLRPQKLYSRPFLLINKGTSRGGDAEFLVLGPRIFSIEIAKNGDVSYEKAGAATLKAHKRTWTYKFKPEIVESENRPYGWQVRTIQKKARDRLPFARWQVQKP